MCSRLCLGILIFLIGVVDIVTAVAAIVLGAWNHPLTWAFAVVMGIAVPMILLSTALMCWPSAGVRCIAVALDLMLAVSVLAPVVILLLEIPNTQVELIGWLRTLGVQDPQATDIANAWLWVTIGGGVLGVLQVARACMCLALRKPTSNDQADDAIKYSRYARFSDDIQNRDPLIHNKRSRNYNDTYSSNYSSSAGRSLSPTMDYSRIEADLKNEMRKEQEASHERSSWTAPTPAPQKRGMYERWRAHLDRTYSSMDQKERQITAQRKQQAARLPADQRSFGKLLDNGGNFAGVTGQVVPPWRR